MAGKWRKGHIGRFWNHDDYKSFPYVRQPIMNSEIEEWKSKGYDYVKSFSGLMYDNRNPMPEWVSRFDNLFDLNNMTYNFYKMSQLEIMPEHVDHFQTYMKLYNVEYHNIRRVLVMLDDWKPGHYLEIDGIGFVNWIAGDYFIWDSDVRHAASNIGTEDRYTLQITGTVIQSDDVYKKIHWYNFPDRQTKKDSLYSPEMAVMKHKMNKSNPYYIYMYNGTIPELADITHTDEVISHLNETGLDIYLFEPLCSYLEGAPQLYPPFGTKHTMSFYSEFHNSHINDLNKIRSDELDTIATYVEKNKLKNVTVKTCDYNSEKFYPFYKNNYGFEILCEDLFLAYFDTSEFQPLEQNEETGNFTRKLICMNWRWAPHRHLIAAYLVNYENIYLTWHFRADLGTVGVEPWYTVPHWLQKNTDAFNKMISGFRDLNNNVPLTLDLDVTEASAITHKHLKNIFPSKVIFDYKKEKYGDNLDRIKKYYNDIFCDIVTESRFAQPTANYSEKTYRPIFYKKPFILCAPPFTLKYLKEQGFKTFNEYWDESYDTIEDHETRLFTIFTLIDKIYNMSIEELREMYKKMKPILEHNRNLLLEKCSPRS